MGYPLWPAGLPQRPSSSGYARTMEDGRLFSPMDKGPDKVRLEYSAAPAPIVSPHVFTNNQWLRFERFWREDTRKGTSLFWMIDPVRHGQCLLNEDGSPILLGDELPFLIDAWDLIAFGKEPPTAVPNGSNSVNFRVSFQLFRMPR